MANLIEVTKCDNELIILAYQHDISFELCRILSGNNRPVAVNIKILTGSYVGTQVFNGVNNALSINTIVCLPEGEYSLLLLGIDWGSSQAFMVTVNGVTYSLAPGTPGNGLVWNPGPIAIAV